MKDQQLDYAGAIESRFPGLIEGVRNVIRESERAYEGADGSSESFLWEHTAHVASLARRLAHIEHLDPLLPSIAALFHDAGKFAGGRYHENGTAEEEEAARIAEPLLRQSGMNPADTRRILSGLRALYNEKAGRNAVADIVHDADFLSKFGALGVANFFAKSALRGRTLRSSLFGYLSKELTYAACLPLNMRTAAGRKLAREKSSASLQFFNLLLAELREAGLADLSVKHIRVAHANAGDRPLNVRIVAPENCGECGGSWRRSYATESGIKCRRVNVDWCCRKCGNRLATSFCLPEIPC